MVASKNPADSLGGVVVLVQDLNFERNRVLMRVRVVVAVVMDMVVLCRFAAAGCTHQ
jgi:hypothetical protein